MQFLIKKKIVTNFCLRLNKHNISLTTLILFLIKFKIKYYILIFLFLINNFH